MAKIKNVTDYLESIAPLQLQESYDNAGLIVGHPDWEVKGVLTSLDCLETTVNEAIERGCNLIVAHHPIVFRGLKKLNGKNYVERTVLKAIKADVAIYAIHTNLDNVATGVNRRIADRLDLRECKITLPKGDDPKIGSGMIGQLAQAMTAAEFLAFLGARMKTQLVRHTEILPEPIKKVAVCGGAGGFTLAAAIQAGAQVLVTADYKYHEFFDADGQIMICDIGHFESEQFTTQLLAELLSNKFSTFAVLCTERNTNPVRYYYTSASK